MGDKPDRADTLPDLEAQAATPSTSHRPPILRDKTMTDVDQRKDLETQPTHPLPEDPIEAEEKETVRSDGKREIQEQECYDRLAYCWPRWKKWMYLGVVAAVQVSMNFNTSVFPNAVNPLVSHFGIGAQEARTGQMIYLICYSIGCELWAPWSEEFGRYPILLASMFLINAWEFLAAWAPNWGSVVIARGFVSPLHLFHVFLCP